MAASSSSDLEGDAACSNRVLPRMHVVDIADFDPVLSCSSRLSRAYRRQYLRHKHGDLGAVGVVSARNLAAPDSISSTAWRPW